MVGKRPTPLFGLCTIRAMNAPVLMMKREEQKAFIAIVQKEETLQV